MAQVHVKLQFAEDGYRLVAGGVESDAADYGEPVEVVCGGETYLAHVDAEEDGSAFSLLPNGWVYMVEALGDAEVVREDLDEPLGGGGVEDEPEETQEVIEG